MIKMTKSSPTNPSVANTSRITTLIFDVDDTLYDVGTGFTAHRNSDGATSFMVEKLNFPDTASAKIVRDEYFARYHSTAKGLLVAEKEGKLPPPPSEWPEGKPIFDPQDLSEWWAENLDFSLLRGPYRDLADMLTSCPLNLVAFSNGPRKYVLRGMKNTRIAKSLGMTTVLVAGLGRRKSNIGESENISVDAKSQSLADDAEATKPGDAPDEDDPAVDVCIESAIDMKKALPELWK